MDFNSAFMLVIGAFISVLSYITKQRGDAIVSNSNAIQRLAVRVVKLEEKAQSTDTVLNKILANQEKMQADIHEILTKIAVMDK